MSNIGFSFRFIFVISSVTLAFGMEGPYESINSIDTGSNKEHSGKKITIGKGIPNSNFFNGSLYGAFVGNWRKKLNENDLEGKDQKFLFEKIMSGCDIQDIKDFEGFKYENFMDFFYLGWLIINKYIPESVYLDKFNFHGLLKIFKNKDIFVSSGILSIKKSTRKKDLEKYNVPELLRIYLELYLKCSFFYNFPMDRYNLSCEDDDEEEEEDNEDEKESKEEKQIDDYGNDDKENFEKLGKIFKKDLKTVSEILYTIFDDYSDKNKYFCEDSIWEDMIPFFESFIIFLFNKYIVNNYELIDKCLSALCLDKILLPKESITFIFSKIREKFTDFGDVYSKYTPNQNNNVNTNESSVNNNVNNNEISGNGIIITEFKEHNFLFDQDQNQDSNQNQNQSSNVQFYANFTLNNRTYKCECSLFDDPGTVFEKAIQEIYNQNSLGKRNEYTIYANGKKLDNRKSFLDNGLKVKENDNVNFTACPNNNNIHFEINLPREQKNFSIDGNLKLGYVLDFYFPHCITDFVKPTYQIIGRDGKVSKTGRLEEILDQKICNTNNAHNLTGKTLKIYEGDKDNNIRFFVSYGTQKLCVVCKTEKNFIDILDLIEENFDIPEKLYYLNSGMLIESNKTLSDNRIKTGNVIVAEVDDSSDDSKSSLSMLGRSALKIDRIDKKNLIPIDEKESIKELSKSEKKESGILFVDEHLNRYYMLLKYVFSGNKDKLYEIFSSFLGDEKANFLRNDIIKFKNAFENYKLDKFEINNKIEKKYEPLFNDIKNFNEEISKLTSLREDFNNLLGNKIIVDSKSDNKYHLSEVSKLDFALRFYNLLKCLGNANDRLENIKNKLENLVGNNLSKNKEISDIKNKYEKFCENLKFFAIEFDNSKYVVIHTRIYTILRKYKVILRNLIFDFETSKGNPVSLDYLDYLDNLDYLRELLSNCEKETAKYYMCKNMYNSNLKDIYSPDYKRFDTINAHRKASYSTDRLKYVSNMFILNDIVKGHCEEIQKKNFNFASKYPISQYSSTVSLFSSLYDDEKKYYLKNLLSKINMEYYIECNGFCEKLDSKNFKFEENNYDGCYFIDDKLNILEKEITRYSINLYNYGIEKIYEKIERKYDINLIVLISGINKQVNMDYFFAASDVMNVSLIQGSFSSMKGMFCGCKKLESVYFDNINTEEVSDLSFSLFECEKLKYINLDKLNTKKVINTIFTFGCCKELKSIFGIDKWNLCNLKRTDGMFFNCIELEYLPNLSNFRVSKLISIAGMFCGCVKLKTINGINTWNIKNVFDMYYAFFACERLKYINLSGWNNEQDNVLPVCMFAMFGNCKALKKIDISGITIVKGSNVNLLFYGCINLISVNLGSITIPYQTETLNNIYVPINIVIDDNICNCFKMPEIGISEKLDYRENNDYRFILSGFAYMFQWCLKLENIFVKNFKFNHKIRNYCLKYMFAGCRRLSNLGGLENLKEIKLSESRYLEGIFKENGSFNAVEKECDERIYYSIGKR